MCPGLFVNTQRVPPPFVLTRSGPFNLFRLCVINSMLWYTFTSFFSSYCDIHALIFELSDLLSVLSRDVYRFDLIYTHEGNIKPMNN